MHRIRFAMSEVFDSNDKLRGTVEVDETYVGGKPRIKGVSKRGRGTNKQPVLALVERGGRVRARCIPDVTGKTLKGAIREHVDRGATIMTDENWAYRGIGNEFKGGHGTVTHSKGEYARGNVHSNTVEGFFAILKRGIIGTFHSVSKQHLHRYLDEFAFRYNTRKLNDDERLIAALRSADGKRLMYRKPEAA